MNHRQQPKNTVASSSSRDYGASVWLPATAEPTAAPTAALILQQSTAQPAAPQTQQASTPAPVMGVLAGLAAAGVFAVRGRK